MRRVVQILLAVFIVLAIPAPAFATIGVGVGTGKIEVKEALQSGGIYIIPPVTVFNNGTETSDYTVSLTLNETQDQLKPRPEWFSFSPDTFTLEPGHSQIVTPTINLPLQTEPGDYFGYLEARPSGTVQQGSATIGIAAATKLSFTVEPSNIFFAIYYRVASLYQQFSPYSYIVSGLIVLAIIWLLIRKYLRIEIRVKK